MASLTTAPADILVIEDNPAFVQCLRYWISRRNLYSAGTLKDALHALRARHFACIILDLSLPDADAETTALLIPALKLASHDARIIVLTGTEANVSVLRRLGATAVLFKTEPGTVDRLLALL